MEREDRLFILLLDYAQLLLRGSKSEQLVHWAASGHWTRKPGTPPIGDRAFALALALFLIPQARSSRDRLFVPYIAQNLARTITPQQYDSLRRVVTSARVTALGFAKPVEKVVPEDFARIRIRARSLVRHIGASEIFEGFPVRRCYSTLDRLVEHYSNCNPPSEAFFEYLERLLNVFLNALHLDRDLVDLDEPEFEILQSYLNIHLQLVQDANRKERVHLNLWNHLESKMLLPG